MTFIILIHNIAKNCRSQKKPLFMSHYGTVFHYVDNFLNRIVCNSLLYSRLQGTTSQLYTLKNTMWKKFYTIF